MINRDADHSVKFDARLVRAPRVSSNFCLFRFKRQANRLTFRVQNDSAECKIYASAGKIVIYNFWLITRNITRCLLLHVSN